MADRSILIQGLIELHLAGEGGQQAVASMQKIIEQAKQVEKATGGLGTGVEKTTKSVNALEAAFGSLGKTVAGYFAAGVVTRFLQDSFLGFARTERQALALEQQLKSLGATAGGGNFREFIAQTSQTFGIIDDDLVPALQRAVLGFKDLKTAQEVVTIASKFAANGIGDVGTNVERITRFFQTGSARSLVDFGINVKGGEQAVLKLDEGIRLLLDTANGMPSTFDDAQASINQWRLEIDNAKDSIGKAEAALISFIQKTATTLGTGISGFLDPENIRKEAEGAKIIADLNAERAKKAFGPEDNPVLRAAQAEQARRDSDAKQKAADDAVKIEQERLAKVADLNEKSAEDLLRSQIDAATKGSDERFALEIELNKRIEAAAIANAQAIGADTVAIAKFFQLQREAILNQPATDPEANTLEPGNNKGREEFEKALEEFRKTEEEKTRIAEEEASKRMDIDYAASALNIKLEKDKRAAALESAAIITGSFSQFFEKNKALQVALAIINTARAVTEALPNYYLAAAVAISGALQVANILRTKIGDRSSPSLGGGTSGGVASAPTQQASNPAQVAPQSQQSLRALSGSDGSGPKGSVIIQIGTAFGDQQAMTKLSRQIAKIVRNDQSELR